MPGETIGEVSVKVRPDTTKFSQELRAQLKKVNDDFQVDVGLNTKGALAEFKALKKQIQGDDINANVKLNTRSLSTAAGFRAPLSGIAKIFEGMQRSLDRAASRSTRLAENIVAARKASVAAVAQTLTWAAQMARLVLSVEAARKAWAGLSKAVTAVGDGIRKIPELASLARHLADLALIGGYIRGIRLLDFVKSLGRVSTYADAGRRAMTGLQVAVNRAYIEMDRLRNIRLADVVRGARRLGDSFKRAGRSVARGVGNMLDSGIRGIGKMFSSAFSGMASMAGKVGSSLAGMSRNMLIVAAVAAILAPALGLISGLIAGLPALLAAAGGGFAAIALGMDGIKAAAKTLAPEVEALKASLSENWQSGLTPVFEQLRSIFPTLQTGLNQVVDGMIPLAQAFTDVVTSAQGMEQIRNILQQTGHFFAALQPMVTGFTQSFLTLANAGANSFGLLATSLNTFAGQWNEMVNRITSNGAFEGALAGLTQVLDSLLSTFTRVFEAGAVAMGQLGGPLATFINGFTDAFVALMPILTSVSGLLFDVLGTALSALGPVFAALGPPIEKLAQVLGPVLTAALQALVPILTPLANFLGQVLVTAINALMPLVTPLVNMFQVLGQTLGGVLTQAATALTPLITVLGDALSQIVVALVPLIPAFAQLAMAILPPLIQIIMQLLPPIIQLAQAVLPILVQAIQAAVPVILTIVQAFTQILPPILGFVGVVASVLIPIITAIGQIVSDIFPAIQMIITGVMNVIQGIIRTVMAVIRGDWQGAWNGVKQILSGAVNAIGGIIGGLVGLVVGILTQLVGRITGIFSNAGSWLVDSGRAIIRGLINGIKSMIGSAVSAVKGVVSRVRNFFPFSPAKEGPFSGKGYTTHSGRALVKDWAKGIEDEAPNAVRAVEDMMTATNKSASAEWSGQIQADGFGITGSVFEGVMSAFNGSRLQVDGNGMAQLVNKVNKVNSRR